MAKLKPDFSKIDTCLKRVEDIAKQADKVGFYKDFCGQEVVTFNRVELQRFRLLAIRDYIKTFEI